MKEAVYIEIYGTVAEACTVRFTDDNGEPVVRQFDSGRYRIPSINPETWYLAPHEMPDWEGK